MALKDQQHPALGLDGLYCDEESFEEDGFNSFRVDDDDDEGGSQIRGQPSIKEQPLPFTLLEEDFFWEDGELETLFSKEKKTHLGLDGESLDGSLLVSRKEAAEWILRVRAHYGFTALTGAFAVNYFDRFVSSLGFRRDKPWMGQLAAVACLSLAAKVEETYVPLLLDLQVEESKYIFEAKTIQRMELLVLSTLQWRMNPVTPISFFDHIVRRLGLKTNLHFEFLRKCELLLLSVVTDTHIMSFRPSVLATAIMLHAIKEFGTSNKTEYQDQLLAVLKINEDEVNDCYTLILRMLGSHNQGQKRKNPSIPCSPDGVIDAFYSSDSSNDSWAASSVSSSLVPLFKRSRPQDLQMRLPPVNRMFVDVLSSPH